MTVKDENIDSSLHSNDYDFECAHESTLSDWGMAKIFAAHYHNNIVYSHAMRMWFTWNGIQWEICDEGQAEQLAKQTIKRMHDVVAPRIEDPSENNRFVKKLVKRENTKPIQDMLSSASNEPGIPFDYTKFDSNKSLVNVQNGIVNLETGELTSHCREQYMSKTLELNYNIEAKCPKWISFLSSIFPDAPEKIEFLQRYFGYCLTGFTIEQVFCIFYGTGSNGKGTLIEVIESIFSHYKAAVNPDVIMKSKYGKSNSNALAGLVGTRLCIVAESDSYQELDESVIKRITGQDTIACRFLYKEYFEYTPEFKLILITNHEPIIKSHDYSIWRRVLKIMFDVKISESNVNKNLRNELNEEIEGIFRWIVEGSIKWFDNGLMIPESIIQSTTDYKNDLDVVGDFLDMCTESGEGKSITNTALYNCYKQWCEGTSNKPYTERTFGKSVVEHGFPSIKLMKLRGKAGLDIKPDIKILIDKGIFCKKLLSPDWTLYCGSGKIV